MTGERNIDTTAAEEEFSAAAPPHPGARGTGETSFGDAEAPAAGGARAAGTPAGDAPAQESESPGGPAQEAAERETPETPGAGDPRSVSPDADKAAEYLALAKRTQADFENYRKRMARENAAAANRGAGKLAKELLPALDHLDLALKAAAGHEDVIRGFAMVRDELIAALGRAGIEAFSPRGEAFDPSEHEAMAQLPAEDAEPGTVIEVYQQGYRIDGTVLRPARVVVAQ
ncbi:MAG TPA: nucleotide exchange factor GrpE [Solirubrobacteraceae bacterium]|nr:nucleotide exchange factor GrpE [Solirubrobacteraceae bacterium]